MLNSGRFSRLSRAGIMVARFVRSRGFLLGGVSGVVNSQVAPQCHVQGCRCASVCVCLSGGCEREKPARAAPAAGFPDVVSPRSGSTSHGSPHHPDRCLPEPGPIQCGRVDKKLNQLLKVCGFPFLTHKMCITKYQNSQ